MHYTQNSTTQRQSQTSTEFFFWLKSFVNTNQNGKQIGVWARSRPLGFREGKFRAFVVITFAPENVMQWGLRNRLLSHLGLQLIMFRLSFGKIINLNQIFPKTDEKCRQHWDKKSGPKTFNFPSWCWMFNADSPKCTMFWSNCTSGRIVALFWFSLQCCKSSQHLEMFLVNA